MTAAQKGRWLILAVIILAFTPVIIDTTVLHIAVPSLTLALGASGTDVLWIIDIYSLLMAGLLLPMGTLGDRMGHRRAMMIGLVIFGMASAFAAYAPTAAFLIAARAGLAVGASMIMPATLAILRQVFLDDKERALALGIWAAVGSSGAAIGPLVGGLLLEHFWWGSVFLVNLPIVCITLPIVFMTIPDQRAGSPLPWKINQALMLVAGIVALVYAIKSTAKSDASLTLIVVSALLGFILVTGFVILQLRTPRPMLDLSLLKQKGIAVGVVIGFFAMMALIGFQLFLALELQFVLEKTPLQAGLFMLPLVIASGISGPLAGFLVNSWGLRRVASGGLGIAALSLFGLGSIYLGSQPIAAALLLATLGFALGGALLASSTAVMASAPVDRAGAAGAMEATAYELGGGLGITFFGVILVALYKQNFNIPPEYAAIVPTKVYESIGEAISVARELGGDAGQVIAMSAKKSFLEAHQTILNIAGAAISFLAGAVFFLLSPKPAAITAAAETAE